MVLGRTVRKPGKFAEADGRWSKKMEHETRKVPRRRGEGNALVLGREAKLLETGWSREKRRGWRDVESREVGGMEGRHAGLFGGFVHSQNKKRSSQEGRREEGRLGEEGRLRRDF